MNVSKTIKVLAATAIAVCNVWAQNIQITASKQGNFTCKNKTGKEFL